MFYFLTKINNMLQQNNYINYIRKVLRNNPKKWLITGCAGFIGSNLLEELLKLNQEVIGVDNFTTGHLYNLEDVQQAVTTEQWKRFNFIEGSIIDLNTCYKAVKNVDFVIHQAALVSVPYSLHDPIATNNTNVNGFLNMLMASRDEKIKTFIYATSSAVYGNSSTTLKMENHTTNIISPYAATKYINEIYAEIFSKQYGLNSIGLRYFNIFGPRQDPNGAYAAVIPKWISNIISNKEVTINGDGKTTRDFCFIDDVIQANLLAALSANKGLNQVYNIALNKCTNLNKLFVHLTDQLRKHGISYDKKPIYAKAIKGEVRHSQADIAKATELLRYRPAYDIIKGLEIAVPWYIKFEKRKLEISR